MPKSSKKNQRVLASFKIPMNVEVRAPKFEPLESLSALDFDRLKKGNHRVEIGFVDGGCCRKLVRAVVKNGLVTGCEIEPCKDKGKAISPEMKSVLQQAQKKIGGGKKWKPVPIQTLAKSTALMSSLIIIGGGCIFICVFGHCVMCCWWPIPHCFIPDIYTGPL
jgi:hypothetical protein